MSDELGANFFTVIDGLLDRWCERRAPNPPRILLPAYPPNGLTDGWHELYDALRDVRSACGDELTEVGGRRIGRAVVTVRKALENR